MKAKAEGGRQGGGWWEEGRSIRLDKPRMASFSRDFPWEFRNARSRASPQTYWLRNSGAGPADCALTSPPGDCARPEGSQASGAGP